MSAPAARSRVFALDFDGVICDSLEESLLVSWNTHAGAPVSAFVEPGLAGVPPGVIDRFTRCRPFARHLGHWLVPFLVTSAPSSHAEFLARYDELATATIRAFTAAALRYRAQVRRDYADRWLAHHRVQPGLAAVLSDAYIVTARDSRSVRQILRGHAVAFNERRIFGSRSNKQGALRAIALREAVEPAAVTLVDDNIENCMAAQAAGYGAWWATWGYNSPADHALAAAHDITPITVQALQLVALPG
ncbi:MAG: HAD family hydrolase [Solirubrobacteraceae bacterium]